MWYILAACSFRCQRQTGVISNVIRCPFLRSLRSSGDGIDPKEMNLVRLGRIDTHLYRWMTKSPTDIVLNNNHGSRNALGMLFGNALVLKMGGALLGVIDKFRVS